MISDQERSRLPGTFLGDRFPGRFQAALHRAESPVTIHSSSCLRRMPGMVPIRSGAAVQAGNRPKNYYSQSRSDIAALVPERCRAVLDVGCGAGELGCLLQQRGHLVTGVELVPEAAEKARALLDRVETLDIETAGF